MVIETKDTLYRLKDQKFEFTPQGFLHYVLKQNYPYYSKYFITCNGKRIKEEDLKEGMNIKLMSYWDAPVEKELLISFINLSINCKIEVNTETMIVGENYKDVWIYKYNNFKVADTFLSLESLMKDAVKRLTKLAYKG